MTSSEIRHSFLEFFREKHHTIVPSSPLLPDAPKPPLHQRRHEPVRAHLPRPGPVPLHPRPRRRHPEMHPRRRQAQRPRGRRLRHLPPHLLRNARQLVSSATTSRKKPSPGPGNSSSNAGKSRPHASTPPFTSPTQATPAPSIRKHPTTGPASSPPPASIRKSTSSAPTKTSGMMGDTGPCGPLLRASHRLHPRGRRLTRQRRRTRASWKSGTSFSSSSTPTPTAPTSSSPPGT